MRISTAFLFTLVAAAAGCSGGDFEGVFGKPEPEKAPVLHVFRGALNPPASNVDRTESNVEVMQLGLRAWEQPVTVTSIEFTFTGSALNHVTYAHLHVDSFSDGVINAGGGDTLIAGISSPSSSTLSFPGLTQVVTPGATVNWLLVFDLAAVAGETFSASFAGGAAVTAVCTSSALPLDLSASAVTGNTKTAINVGTLAAVVGPSNPGNTQVTGAENNLKVLHLSLDAGAVEKVMLRRLVFTDSGSGSLVSVEAVRLWIDGDSDGTISAGDTQIGGNNTFLISTRTVTWDMSGSPITIQPSSSLRLLLFYDFSSVSAPPLGSNYKAGLANSSGVDSYGGLSTYLIAASGSFPVAGGLMSIPTGSLAVSAGSAMPAGVTVSPSTAQSVVQVRLDASASTEDISLSSMSFMDIGGGATVPPNLISVNLYSDNGATPGQLDPGSGAGSDTLLVSNIAFSGSSLHVVFPGALLITKGTAQTWILVYVFGAGVGGNYKATIDPATRMVATGSVSGVTITPTGPAVTGNVFILAGTVAPPTAWAPIIPGGTGPGATMYHSGLYDPANSRMVFFGGTASTAIAGGAVNTTHTLSITTVGNEFFAALSPSGTAPAARYAHSAAYDSGAQRMIVFGGFNNSSPTPAALSDVHALTLAAPPGTEAWSQLWPSGTGPSAGLAHASAVYDRIGNRLIIFGGRTTAGAVNQSTHFLTLGASPQWTQVSLSGTPPSARCGHAAVFDALTNSMLVFGGNDGAGNHMNDTWMLDLSGNAWNLIGTSTLPVARSEMGCGHDPNSRRFYVFGGDDGSGLARSDVYYFSYASSNWVSLSPTGSAPARQGTAGAFETINNRLVFFAGGVIGTSGNTLLNDTLELR